MVSRRLLPRPASRSSSGPSRLPTRAPPRASLLAKALIRSPGPENLERRDGGLWPRFEIDTLVACMADLGSRNYWPQWRAIHCPALVILGERGIFHKHAEQVVRQLSPASIVTIPGSGHDVHLDAPEAWVRSLANFANSLTAAS